MASSPRCWSACRRSRCVNAWRRCCWKSGTRSEGNKRMAEFVTVAKDGDVPVGEARVFAVDGKHIALCNVDGTLYAIDDVCTHDGGPLGEGFLEGDQIECPRHGARFDVKTGKALTLPAVMPVNSYPVQVEGDEIKVQV